MEEYLRSLGNVKWEGEGKHAKYFITDYEPMPGRSSSPRRSGSPQGKSSVKSWNESFLEDSETEEEKLVSNHFYYLFWKFLQKHVHFLAHF